MFIGILLKAIRRVKPYTRRTGFVVGYTQRGRPSAKQRLSAANRFFEHQYKRISEWALESVFAQIKKGEHIGSIDDAKIDAEQAAFEAMRRYESWLGSLEEYVRPQIKYAVIQHIRDERSRGMTGTRALYAKISGAKTQEEKERWAGEFPKIEEVGEASAFSPGSDEVLMAGQALLSNEDLQDALGRQVGPLLKKIRAQLEAIQKRKGTWKTRSFTKRKLEVFRYKFFDNMSFREVARKMGMDVKDVHTDYAQIRQILTDLHIEPGEMPPDLRGRAVYERAPSVHGKERWDSMTQRWLSPKVGPVKEWKEMSPAERETVRSRLGVKKSLADHDVKRIKWNLERLKRACERGYPERHIDFLLDVLSYLLAEFAVDRSKLTRV